eukprot:COSAG02_NODE_12694_length_1508_cov_5.488290_1_plen_383_part_01
MTRLPQATRASISGSTGIGAALSGRRALRHALEGRCAWCHVVPRGWRYPGRAAFVEAMSRGARCLSTGGYSCHYRVLGLQPSCTDKELKAAYREKVTRWHPDVFYGAEMSVDKARAEEVFRRSTEAFEAIVQERSNRNTENLTSQRYSWMRSRSPSHPRAPTKNTANTAHQGFWQRPGDPRKQSSGGTSTSSGGGVKSRWGSELDEFFQGVRKSRSSPGWSYAHTQSTRRRTQQGDRDNRMGAQFADDLHLKFGVMWADEWSKLFDPPRNKHKPFQSSSASTGNRTASQQTPPCRQWKQARQKRQEERRVQEQQRRRRLNGELDELRALYNSGAITEEELLEAKAVVLAAAATEANNQQGKPAEPEPKPKPEPKSTVHLDPFI